MVRRSAAMTGLAIAAKTGMVERYIAPVTVTAMAIETVTGIVISRPLMTLCTVSAKIIVVDTGRPTAAGIMTISALAREVTGRSGMARLAVGAKTCMVEGGVAPIAARSMAGRTFSGVMIRRGRRAVTTRAIGRADQRMVKNGILPACGRVAGCTISRIMPLGSGIGMTGFTIRSCTLIIASSVAAFAIG